MDTELRTFTLMENTKLWGAGEDVIFPSTWENLTGSMIEHNARRFLSTPKPHFYDQGRPWDFYGRAFRDVLSPWSRSLLKLRHPLVFMSEPGKLKQLHCIVKLDHNYGSELAFSDGGMLSFYKAFYEGPTHDEK